MPAAAGWARRIAIIASGNTSMEEVDWQDKGLRVSGPCASAACPNSTGCGTVIDTAAETAAVITLPEAQAPHIVARPCATEGARPVEGKVCTINVCKRNEIASASAHNSCNQDTGAVSSGSHLSRYIRVDCRANIGGGGIGSGAYGNLAWSTPRGDPGKGLSAYDKLLSRSPWS